MEIKKPSKERGCEGKINLGSAYIKNAQRLAEKHGKQLGVYVCPHCGGYHLTSKLYKSDEYAPLVFVSEVVGEMER